MCDVEHTYIHKYTYTCMYCTFTVPELTNHKEKAFNKVLIILYTYRLLMKIMLNQNITSENI